MRLTLARNAGDANVEDADAAEACDANGEDTDAAEARRILGIGPSDADVEAHLSAGRNCLGTQVTLLLPAGDAPRTDAMLLAATKLTKLGASVQVVCATDAHRAAVGEAIWAEAVPYPRCVAISANASSAAAMAGALRGSAAVMLSADIPAAHADAVASALALVASAAGGAVVGDALGGGVEHELPLPGRVAQLVALSGVEVYGGGGDGAAGVVGAVREDAASLGGGGAAGERLRRHEALLAGACAARLAVLRSAPLYSEAGASAPDSLLSDALGLGELLDELAAGVHERLGLVGGGGDGGDGGESRGGSGSGSGGVAALRALLPHGATAVQLTHSADLAGASVHAVVAALEGAYHVCSAPTPLQAVLDGVAARRGWEAPRLRDGGEPARGAGAGARPRRWWCSEKLRAAGYSCRAAVAANGAAGLSLGGTG